MYKHSNLYLECECGYINTPISPTDCRPVEMFHNRLEVESINVRDAITLDANHLLVVYRQESGHIERRIVEGPTIFMPTAHEWLATHPFFFLMSRLDSVSFFGFPPT